MTISTGNYRTRMGVNQIAFPAQTVDGEKVIIEEKITRANQSTLLVSEDGRVFEADQQYSQKLRELGEDAKAALMDEYESVREAVQGRLPELMADAKEALSE